MPILNTLPERAKALRHGTIIERVHCYVGQLVNTTGCKVVRVGGVNDHVHILFLLSRDVAISHIVEEIKRNSSRWIKTLAIHFRAFAWQNGYGVFSVSQSIVDKTLDYISNQEMHHKRFSFQDEYRQFLLSYGVEYDEAYVLIKAFALSGRGDSTMRKTQGVASLALGYVLHWAFSPSLLNPKTSVSNVKHTYLLTCQLVNPLT